MTADAGTAPTIDISLIVNTYRKPRHLALVLASIALQRGVEGRMELVVADDGSDDGTAGQVARFAAEAPFPVRFTTEPHDGFRLARVRNRGAAIAEGATLLFLDGDSILPPNHVATHLARRRPGWAQIGDVIRLPEATSAGLDPGRLAGVDLAALEPADERRRLGRRHRKSLWQNLIRHPSKPRLAGGNFAVWRRDYRRVNGSDEAFRGWGQEDDDLGLRLRAAGIRLGSILAHTRTYHVWHPTDPSATPRWRDGVNVPYFLRRGRLTACRSGLVRRDRTTILWGLPVDLAATAVGRSVERLLAGAPRAAAGARCEVDVVVWPGGGGFSRPAECRVLLVAEGHGHPRRSLARKADRMEIVTADEGNLAGLLDAVG